MEIPGGKVKKRGTDEDRLEIQTQTLIFSKRGFYIFFLWKIFQIFGKNNNMIHYNCSINRFYYQWDLKPLTGMCCCSVTNFDFPLHT